MTHQHLTIDRHIPQSTIHLVHWSLHPDSAPVADNDLIMMHTPRPWLNRNSTLTVQFVTDRGLAESAAPPTTRFHGSVAPAARTAAFIGPAAADDRSHPATAAADATEAGTIAAGATSDPANGTTAGARATRFQPKPLGSEKQSQQLNLRGFDNIETFSGSEDLAETWRKC